MWAGYWMLAPLATAWSATRRPVRPLDQTSSIFFERHGPFGAGARSRGRELATRRRGIDWREKGRDSGVLTMSTWYTAVTRDTVDKAVASPADGLSAASFPAFWRFLADFGVRCGISLRSGQAGGATVKMVLNSPNRSSPPAAFPSGSPAVDGRTGRAPGVHERPGLN